MKRKLLILFLTCVVGWLSPLNAQTTVTVGSGTGSYQTIPSGAYSEIPATFTQQIYTSTELSTAGISSGSYISSIAFTVGGTVGTSTFNWTVYMTEVDKGSFSSSSDFVILDDAPLFSGNVTLDGNLCNIEFQPPYQYNGGNLLVAVLDNMGTTNGSSTSFLTHDIGGWPNYYAIAARHTSAIDVSNPTAAIQKQGYAYRNNIQFTIGSVSTPTGPTVTVTATDTDVYIGETVTPTASATGGSESYTSYEWACTSHTLQGTEFWGSGNEYTFMPTATGDYTFTCTVTDSESNTATSDPVTVKVTEESESAIDLNKQYRVKVYSGISEGKYLNINSNNAPTRATQVGVASQQESNNQIFTVEEVGDGNYYLKTADGYYIRCNNNDYTNYNDNDTYNNGLGTWGVAAYSTTDKSPLTFEYSGEVFYIKDANKTSTSNYFKIQSSLVYCDAASGLNDPSGNGYVCTWTLEEYVKPLEFTITADKTNVCEGDAVELTATVDGDGTYTYEWTVTEGSGEFSEAAATTYFTPSSAGNCVIKCSVNDGTSTVEKTISLTVYDVPELTVSQNTFDIKANGTATFEVTYSGTNEPNISDRGIINEIDRSVANKLVITTTPLKETTELTFKLYNFDSPNGEYDGVWGYLCAAEETVTINVEEALFVEIETENDVTSICEDDANGIKLIATPKFAEGDVTYSWTPTEGLDDPTSATPTFIPSDITEASSEVTYTCTVDDGVTESSETISLTVYKKPAFEVPTSVVVNYGETATIEVVYEPEPSYMNINGPYPENTDYTNYTYKTSNPANPDTIVLSYVPTVDADLVFEADNCFSYSNTIGDYLCNETKTVQVRVVNENKEVEIGTNENLFSRNYLPVKADRKYSITQQIYTAEELGIKESSQINSISFYATWCNNNARNIDVYLVKTDKEAFSTTTDFVNMLGTAIPNFSGSVEFVNEGWTTISFAERPFTYEPGTNILVCVNDKTGGTAGTFEFGHYSTADDVRSIANYGDTQYDATNFSASNDPGFDLKQNNHIKLGYVAKAQNELVATINVDDTEICDGDNANKFEMFATKVENATYNWYLVVDGVDNLLEENVREYTYSNPNPGTYKIKLVVTQNGVSKEDIEELIINPTPNAAVVMGTNGYGFVGEQIGFTKVGEHIDGTSYAIDLNVGDYHYNITEKDTHTFSENYDGTFSYTVEASIGECETTSTNYVTIYPAASFTAGDEFYACAGQEVVFTNTTKEPNSGDWNFGEGEGFVWDFGDGETEASNEETVTHTYAAANTYNITLTVTKSGISNVYEHQVIVSELPVVYDLSWDKTTIYEEITFTATSNATSYIWEIGDDVQANENEATFTYQFQSLGDHKVAVTAVSATGCSTRREETINVTEKVSEPKVMVNNVEVSSIDMGYRPYGAWMRPIEILITPDGTTDLKINSITIVDEDDEGAIDFIKMTESVENVTIEPEKTLSVLLTHDKNNEVIAEIKPGHYGFANTATMTINYGENQTKVINIKYNAYEPKVPDVWEKAKEITAGTTTTETLSTMRSNYLLEGATSAHKDAVFKFTFTEATQLTATVNGTNPVAYVYPEDFGGEPGPGLTNYVGYVNPDAPVQLEFKPLTLDFEELELEPIYGTLPTEGELWTSGPNTTANAFFRGGQEIEQQEIDGLLEDVVVDTYVTSKQLTTDNYFITKDKYYISETARFSMNVWANRAYEMSYYVFVSEDGTNFTPVYEGTVSTTDKTNSIDISLSEYAGKEYYIGVVHVGVETLPSSTSRIRLDNIKLYEPETRALRANAEPTLNIMLEADTYYLVAAAANNDFTVTIGSETLSLPGQATDPRPKDYSNVAAELEQLTWTFGNFTEEYQVLFGTTNPPTEVLVDWNNNIENASCALSKTLMTNTVYYWQVNAKNILGTTEGTVWRFATPFDAPQNLALNPLDIEENETSVFTWNAIDNASLTGYNIYIDNVKNNTELVTSATYTISGLSYKVDPYIVQVEAVYNVDGFEIKSKSYKIELKVNAEASVKGFVYDATTGEPIVGATVTYATTELTTDANGYTGKVPAGNYRAVARMAGYNKSEVDVELVPSEETYTYNFTLEPTMTLATGVIATERDDKTAVDVEWQFNLEGGPMIEDFENGFTYEWTTSADYPWEVVANGYEEGSAGYELYGGYCVKSTNSDYDYDQENDGYKEDGDTPFQLTTSYLELTTFIPFDGKISFYYRIDSDQWGDYGKFYIDDVQQGYNLMGENSQWLTDSKLEFDVTAGTHTFKWEYSKDEGWYYGTDAFYVDNITFYENTNLYNVYRRDILTAEDPTNLAENLTEKELADTDWANEDFADGIYQWGVSVEYNEPASDLLNEDFEGVEEPESFLTGWTKYTEEVVDSYGSLNQWHVNGTGEYGIPAYGYAGYSAFVSPLPGESVFYFVTPMVNASRQATLEFDYIIPCYSKEDFPNDFSKFKVAYSTSPTGPWTDLKAFNKTSVEDWAHAKVELPLKEELYIAFIDQNVENWGKGIGLDNVRIHRVAVKGVSEIAWSNLIAKGNELVTEGNWNDEDNWSRTHVPTAEEVAVIKAAGTVNEAGAVANAVLVDNGTLTIGENGVLTASTVIDSVAADITINAGGQLVHSNEGVMATFVKGIQAYTDADNNDGWYTISSPLAADINASDVTNLLSGDFDLYRYDEPTHYWENYEDAEDAEGPNNTDWDNNSAIIEKGRGYLYANSANTELSFAGELNVANVTTTLSAQASSLTGFNLLGNPFAHNIYKGAAFNGSIADAHYTLNYHGEWQVVTSDNPIKSGAGFLVQATTDGADLTISKTNAQTRAAANSMLAVTVVNNVFEDVAYVSFNDGIGLEKIGHMNEYAPMVYIPGDFNNYAYATVEEDVTEVPVNFEAMTMGEYTIAVKAKNCEYETMILVDNLTGKETNLLKDSYTFMATTTDDPDRFVIKLAKDAEVEDSFIYINNGELIFDNLSNDAIINVFDVLGRNIATFNNCGDTTFRVSTDLFADGVYMVRVIEGNNVKVQKMVIE